MYIITIIPLTHKTPFTELNYFSLTSYEEGSCVDAPLGKQTLVGIVIGSKQVLESKQDLKNANFQIKQLPKQIPKFKLPYLYTYKELSRYYFKSLDFIIKNTLPYDRIEDQIFRKENIIEKNKILLIQDTFEKRIEYYKEIINNSYKRTAFVTIDKGGLLFSKIISGNLIRKGYPILHLYKHWCPIKFL